MRYTIMADDLGDIIRKARLNRGLSRAELATLLGVSEVAVTFWENGKREPKFLVGVRLGNLLGFNWSKVSRQLGLTGPNSS